MTKSGLAWRVVAPLVTWIRGAFRDVDLARVTPALASVSFLILAVGLVGCSTPTGPLARPVVIGASVSSGERSVVLARGESPSVPDSGRVRPGDGAPATEPDAEVQGSLAPVGLAPAVDACIAITHGKTKSLAEGAMAFSPVESLSRQVRIANAMKPTVVFAIDALFWTAYGPADSDDERVKRLKSCCDVLSSIEVPLVVGNLPDMRGSVAKLLGDAAAPSEVERANLNRHIREWATTRSNVILLDLSQLVDDVRGGGTVPLGVAELSRQETSRIVAADGLHLTSDGEVALATLALSSLVAMNVIPRDAVYSDLRVSRALLDQYRARRDAEGKARRGPGGASGSALTSDSKIDRQRYALERSVRTDEALRSGDVELATKLYAERFSSPEADIRTRADVLECELALSRMPALRSGLMQSLADLRREAADPLASNETVASAIELALTLNELQIAAEYVPIVAGRADRARAGREKPLVPSALGYAHRIYDWFVEQHPDPAVRVFTDADATARELAELRRTEREKLRFAERAGFGGGGLRLRTPREELTRFSNALRSVGRQDDAARVLAIAGAETDM
jgi:hypothetical protein